MIEIKVYAGKLTDVVQNLQKENTEIRLVRGNVMTTQASLFNEFATALQFPNYFGGNWDALNDCMSDLAWWPAQQRLLLISDTSEILPKDDVMFALLLDILLENSEEWACDDDLRKACPLIIILHTEMHDLDTLIRRLDLSCVRYSLYKLTG